MSATADDPFEHTRMTLGEHLDELRRRLFKGLAAVALVFTAGMFFQDELVEFVKRPYTRAATMLNAYWLERAHAQVEADPSRWEEFFHEGWPEQVIPRLQTPPLVGIKPGEGFMFGLKIVFYVSLAIGGPVLLWQMWQFVAAGLYPQERRLVFAYFPVSVVMLVLGLTFGYQFLVPYAIYFLNQDQFVEMNVTADYYLTFLVGLCLALGVVFQLPLILTFLGRVGMVEAKSLTKYRGHFLIGAFVFAAILTPPDPITQLMLGIPLVVLYEIGVLGVRFYGSPRGTVPATRRDSAS